MAAEDVFEFAVNTPAGTTQASPLVTLTQLPVCTVDRIAWRVPAGSLGVMGWRISNRSVPVIPRNTGGWIVAHQTDGGWDLQRMADSGDWSVTTYNTGAFSHALYVSFYVRYHRPAPPQFTLIDPRIIAGEPDPEYTGVRRGA